MKITDVEAIILKQDSIEMIGDGSQDTVLVLVHTDEGITGVGEVDSSPYVVKSVIEAKASHMVCMGLRDVVIGEDPFDVEKIWWKMYEKSYYYGRRSVAIHAMSGIDIAIWDILGKALKMPVGKLLGGVYRTQIPAYCSVLMPPDEDGIKRIVENYLPQGFLGFKFGWGALGRDKKTDIFLVETARKLMGPDKLLMIDIGMVWGSTKHAIDMCNCLKQYDPYWIEEPLSPDNVVGYKRLCETVDVRISAGEELGGLHEFKQLIDYCGIDIVQPDLSRCGGFTMARKIADMAVTAEIPVVPHAFKTGVLMAATLQYISTLRNADFLEYVNQETVLSKTLVKDHFAIDKDGNISIPQKPGLGIELDMSVVERYRVDA